MKINNPFRRQKKSNKTIFAMILVPIAALWDRISNMTSNRRRAHGWRRIFG
jgi:hypothetical protein